MWEISPWQLFLLGGPVMWPILLCSILATTIVIEKWLFFKSVDDDVMKLQNRLFELIRSNDMRAALAVCDQSRSLTGKILKAGVLQYGRSKDEVVAAMDEVSRCEVPRLEERLPALLTIGNITPLLGLLGTVTGMCSLFHTIQTRAAVMNPIISGDIAGGIWQALITTAAGLVVAIPVLAAYNHFVNCQNKYALEMEKSAVTLANFLMHVAETRPETNRGKDFELS